jgi:glycerol-3-phosphate dehydrogenase
VLVEAGDFSCGTSSRSSKLVHGGFRYLRNGQIKLTYESVRERERLLKEGRGLVSPLGFLLACYKGDTIPPWMFRAALVTYDLLAFKWGHQYYESTDLRALCPSLAEDGLKGGFRYLDAQTDDARLVMRVLQEAVREGGCVLNYTRATRILRGKSGGVQGFVVRDEAPESAGRSAEVRARAVINATGAWADDLRQQVGGAARLRKLRGSHLIFPASKLPLTRAVSILHPADHRAVFAIPWEGVTLIGTTDVDQGPAMEVDPSISIAEAEYLLAAVQRAFPGLNLDMEDVQATFAGVRPVVGTGKADPSKESREHVLWEENGLLTVAGGKLTTFRLMAQDALEYIQDRLPGSPSFSSKLRMLDPQVNGDVLSDDLTPAMRLRILGRYGKDAAELVTLARPEEVSPIEGTPYLWAELRWAAHNEGVVHLDDLLLRRLRIGLLLPQGGTSIMSQIKGIAQGELGWDDRRWKRELEDYQKLWERSYYLPGEQPKKMPLPEPHSAS